MSFNFKVWSTETLTSTDLNDQFAKIENKFGNIKNADLASDANITSQKLQDRYAVAYQTIVLGADTWGNDFIFQDSATQSAVTESRIYPELPGKRAYLASVSISLIGYAESTSGHKARIWVTHNGVTISDFIPTTDIPAEQTGFIRAGVGSSAFASPLVALQTGDYIGIQLGRDNDTGSETVKASSVSITLSYKVELTS